AGSRTTSACPIAGSRRARTSTTERPAAAGSRRDPSRPSEACQLASDPVDTQSSERRGHTGARRAKERAYRFIHLSTEELAPDEPEKLVRYGARPHRRGRHGRM